MSNELLTTAAGKSQGPVLAEHRLIKVPEVADFFATTEPRIYEMVRLGYFDNVPGVVVRLGRHLRFDPQKLELWVRQGGQALPGGWRQEAA